MLISFKFNYISYTIDKIDCFDLFTLKWLWINKSVSLIYVHTPVYYIIINLSMYLFNIYSAKGADLNLSMYLFNYFKS